MGGGCVGCVGGGRGLLGGGEGKSPGPGVGIGLGVVVTLFTAGGDPS